ncbi:MAG: hypothetical protein ACI9MB_004964, partial [Verrucomicrobiales bacterium]
DVVDACYYLTAGESVEIKVMRGLADVTVQVVPSVLAERAVPNQVIVPEAEEEG